MSVYEDACKEDAWYFFRNFLYTRDPQDFLDPVKKYPDYPFLENLVGDICARKPDLKPVHPRIAVPKSRQMLVSWTCCACALWLAKFFPHRHIFLQSEKEDKAIELLERCQFMDHHMPEPIGATGDFTAKLARFSNGSKIQAVAQGPNQIAQYTPTMVVMDEMALQETAEYAYRAMIPALRAGGQLVGPSTPRGMNFFEMFVHRIPATKVIRVHYTAHPTFQKEAKELGGWPQWVEMMIEKEGYNRQGWRQEMEIDFNVAFGESVFAPPFSRQTHVANRMIQANPAWTIYEGWDVGFVHPATIWYQHNPITKQDMVLREVVGTRIVLPDYVRNVVLPMRKEIAPHGVYESFCDPAGCNRTDKGDRSVDTLHNFGIYPRYKKSNLDAGIETMRLNLGVKPDGTARTIIDPRCSEVINALDGGVVYEDVNSEDEKRQIKIKWSRYKHIMDAWRYAQIHVSGLANLRKPSKKHAPAITSVHIGSNLEWTRTRRHRN